MSRTVLAEFTRADALLEGARAARRAGGELIDGYAPVPVEGLARLLGSPARRVRLVMFIGGITVAACAYTLEWWSAVVNYPIDSGGRPLHSWPVFLMFPFSVGLLSAAICGFVAFLVTTGLPRLHHPVFALEGFERATQDRFALEIALPDAEEHRSRVVEALRAAGATAIREVPP